MTATEAIIVVGLFTILVLAGMKIILDCDRELRKAANKLEHKQRVLDMTNLELKEAYIQLGEMMEGRSKYSPSDLDLEDDPEDLGEEWDDESSMNPERN